MSIGHGSHNCGFCNNYISSDSRRNCLKYDFIFPKIGFNYLCKEYRDKDNNSGLYIADKLNDDTLYYYYDDLYEIFDTFHNLQYLVFDVWIKEIDKRYEIIKNNSSEIINDDYFIEIRDYNSCYFPNAGSNIILKAADLSLSATVYNVL